MRLPQSMNFNPLPLYRGRPQISTNKYPSIRLLISNFDIYAIILSTRFSKLTYILNKIFFFSKIHGANIPGFLCSLHIRTSISYSNKPLVFFVLITLSTKWLIHIKLDWICIKNAKIHHRRQFTVKNDLPDTKKAQTIHHKFKKRFLTFL